MQVFMPSIGKPGDSETYSVHVLVPDPPGILSSLVHFREVSRDQSLSSQTVVKLFTLQSSLSTSACSTLHTFYRKSMYIIYSLLYTCTVCLLLCGYGCLISPLPSDCAAELTGMYDNNYNYLHNAYHFHLVVHSLLHHPTLRTSCS